MYSLHVSLMAFYKDLTVMDFGLHGSFGNKFEVNNDGLLQVNKIVFNGNICIYVFIQTKQPLLGVCQITSLPSLNPFTFK